MLWLGDVGERDREEIDLVTRGGNYGWPRHEGTRCFDGPCGPDDDGDDELVFPVVEWTHDEVGRAAVGGHVYRGEAVAELRGVYVYADWGMLMIWGLFPPLEDAGLCGVSPVGSDAGEVLLAPGRPDESVIIERMRERGVGRMPPLASHRVDEHGVALVEAWIRSLDGCP